MRSLSSIFSDRIIQGVLEKSHDGPLQLLECLARDIKVLLEVASLLK